MRRNDVNAPPSPATIALLSEQPCQTARYCSAVETPIATA